MKKQDVVWFGYATREEANMMAEEATDDVDVVAIALSYEPRILGYVLVPHQKEREPSCSTP
jgi:hypothetical protein